MHTRSSPASPTTTDGRYDDHQATRSRTCAPRSTAPSPTSPTARLLKSAPSLERPRQAEHGDYATNAALMLAKPVGRPPREVAERARAGARGTARRRAGALEVAGPGFLNLVLADAWYARGARRHAGRRRGLGRRRRRIRRRASTSSSSAPTRPGPVHVGGTRNAAYGDALARILAFHGHDVQREFYVNDYGSQVQPARRVDPRAGARRGAAPRTATGRVRQGPRGRDRGRRRPAGRRAARGSASS